MEAIRTNKLTKKYGTQTVVNQLDLSIAAGELFALLGVNGAGKTTTIKMLTGLTRPTSGDAQLLGKSILKADELEKIKAKINLSPQESAVAGNLTVLENLEFFAGIYGKNRVQSQKSAGETAHRLGLTDVLHKKAKTLSGGMQRRLSLALALISQPEILFLDEPTLGLDVLARRELWTIIKDLKGETTIILTTHYLEEVEALADHVGIMSQGKLVAEGTVNVLLTQTSTSSLEEAFVQLVGS